MVDRICEMHEEGSKTVREIADDFGLPFGTVVKICYYQRRAEAAVKFRRVEFK